MPKRLNIIFIVVDSLRAQNITDGERLVKLPFLSRLRERATYFSRAYATECWTLPTHISMFTGLLPSEHEAHFRTMEYAKAAPTLAEHLHTCGYATALLTRNSLLDGTIPGATRGFAKNERILRVMPRISPISVGLVLAKPRVRRLIQDSGFLGLWQKNNRDFINTMARMTMPADREVLRRALDHVYAYRAEGVPHFIFLNLYDVHAPYSPSESSPMPAPFSLAGLEEIVRMQVALQRISSHAYLRADFRMPQRSRAILLRRYLRSIELMDSKLAWFFDSLDRIKVWEDTAVVLTSDHGEAFGEHGLYFHDASTFNTHLHVPLWVSHPSLAPGEVADVVSMRGIFDLVVACSGGVSLSGTIADPSFRERWPIALAEHYFYPHCSGMLPSFATDQRAAIVGHRKAVIRHNQLEMFDLRSDPEEASPLPCRVDEFLDACRSEVSCPVLAAASVENHLRR